MAKTIFMSDKCLKCISFQAIFAAFLGKWCALCYNLYSFSHFTLRYGSFLYFVGFWTFCPCFDPSWVYFDSPRITLSCHTHGRKKNRRMLRQWTPRLVHRESYGPWCLYFLWGLLFSCNLFDFLAVIIPLLHMTVRLPQFYYKKEGSHPHIHP